VGLGGLEPPTSRLSSARSNQLSYRPKAFRPRAHKLVLASQRTCPDRKRNEGGEAPQYGVLTDPYVLKCSE
jgi:hypothetical protein